MMKFIRNLVRKEIANTDTLMAQAVRMDDDQILVIARNLDRTHKSTKPGDRLRAYVEMRNRNRARAL